MKTRTDKQPAAEPASEDVLEEAEATETETDPDESPDDTEAEAREDSEEEEEEEQDADRPARRRLRESGTPWLGKAVTMAVLAASVVTAGMQWHRAEGYAGRESDREAVAERAEEFGQALLSYDHKDVNSARNRVLAMASDDFAKTYDVAFTGGLESVITKLKADATATARTVYVSDVGEGNAKAVVVMDSEVHSTAGTRRVLGSYLDMKLTRQDGQWKVTEVNSIGAANESMTDPDGKQTGPSPSTSPTPSP
ncbi:hypothetical protein [Spirillospora sp. NPDC048819]|uniref:hypothetical protein n=1 Tax=Spirillospora sp. NPDC048819 TaxID=3155268 RepID=UPI0033E6B061